MRAGRARWKIENEGFNNLKNHGYHLEHNFGHDQQHLSEAFFVLNLLAFFMHQKLSGDHIVSPVVRFDELLDEYPNIARDPNNYIKLGAEHLT